jgi:hypothetical protein
MNYFKLDTIKVDDILLDYAKVTDKIHWVQSLKGQQTGVQYAATDDPFVSAVGTIPLNRLEKEYSLINPLFQNTLFEEIIKKYNLYRSRLMWVNSGSCYSVHRDTSPRLHIPLITNPDCMFVFPDTPELVHLQEGNIYAVNTLKKHSFCNFSSTPRLHFIGCMSIDDYYKHVTPC